MDSLVDLLGSKAQIQNNKMKKKILFRMVNKIQKQDLYFTAHVLGQHNHHHHRKTYSCVLWVAIIIYFIFAIFIKDKTYNQMSMLNFTIYLSLVDIIIINSNFQCIHSLIKEYISRASWYFLFHLSSKKGCKLLKLLEIGSLLSLIIYVIMECIAHILTVWI